MALVLFSICVHFHIFNHHLILCMFIACVHCASITNSTPDTFRHANYMKHGLKVSKFMINYYGDNHLKPVPIF